MYFETIETAVHSHFDAVDIVVNLKDAKTDVLDVGVIECFLLIETAVKVVVLETAVVEVLAVATVVLVKDAEVS